MSEMLERVKTAIFVSADDAHNTWSTPDHPECVRMARTVLAALREPGEDALEDGRKAIADWQAQGDWSARGQIKIALNAMIDAALAE